jgi:hypothetical protein
MTPTPSMTWVILLWLSTMVSALAEDRDAIVKERTSPAYAKPGSKCQTEDGTAAAMTLSTRQRMTEVASRQDMKAFEQFFTQGLAIRMRPLTVFVEERQGVYVKIRPEGRLESLWVGVFGLQCPQEPKTRQGKKGAR